MMVMEKIRLSLIVELHPEEVSALDLGHIIHDEFVIQQGTLYYTRITFGMPVEMPSPHGTNTSPSIFPSFGAVFPHPFVDCFPSGSKLA
jgi:hypothetical protein